jgi:hypothetical protein
VDEGDTLPAVRCAEMNPVRAGMVEQAQDWEKQ